uniref:Uncharacterized protein n=1 Tax=Anguilla anguilla TaxID=7936 RepID=A0A0E9PWX5_ANGAN
MFYCLSYIAILFAFRSSVF